MTSFSLAVLSVVLSCVAVVSSILSAICTFARLGLVIREDEHRGVSLEFKGRLARVLIRILRWVFR